MWHNSSWVQTNFKSFAEEKRNEILLILVTWVAYFFYSNDFGLYEDDFHYIGHSVNQLWDKQFYQIWVEMTHITQGRPFGFLVLRFGTYLLCMIGGLPLCYFAAMCLVAYNSILFYRLVLMRYSPFAALVGALVFIVFPADTTKPLLIHAFTLQLSLTTMLLAFHAYGKGQLIKSYVFILLSLLNYESPMLPFLLAPLYFSLEGNGKWKRPLIQHICILILIMVGLFMIRKSFGEMRVGEVDFVKTALLVSKCILDGPLTVFRSFIEVPGIIWVNLRLALPFVFISLVVLFFFFILFFKEKEENEKWDIPTILRHLLLCLSFIAISYLLAFTHYPAVALTGRVTSVHLAATFGAALFIGVLSELALRFFSKYKWAVVLVCSFYLSLLVGYGALIQNDLKLSWQVQKRFWSSVVELCPDLNEKTLIFVNGDFNENAKFIESNSWTDPEILDFMFAYSSKSLRYPQLVRDEAWISRLTYSNDTFKYGTLLPFLFQNQIELNLQDHHVVVLRRKGNSLVRESGDLVLQEGKVLHLDRAADEALYTFTPTVLGKMLLHNSDDLVKLTKWSYPQPLFEPSLDNSFSLGFERDESDPYSGAGPDNGLIYLHPGSKKNSSVILSFKEPIRSLEFDVYIPNIERYREQGENGLKLAEVNVHIYADGTWLKSDYLTWKSDSRFKLDTDYSSRITISVDKGRYGNASDGIYIKNIRFN